MILQAAWMIRPRCLLVRSNRQFIFSLYGIILSPGLIQPRGIRIEPRQPLIGPSGKSGPGPSE